MTELVIIVAVMYTPVSDLLDKWPSLSAVWEDARATHPDLQLVAVRRWAARNSIPAAYLAALANGAKRRKIGVSLSDLVNAHVPHVDQSGHSGKQVQVVAENSP